MRRSARALATFGLGLAALGLVACAGDDTNPPPPDAGVTDATLVDGGLGDSSSDGGEGGACVAFDASSLSDAEVQAGRAIVVASKCGKCHGQQLQGNQNGVPSTTAEGGTAYPPDLTPDPETGLGCWTNEQIARAFLHGIDDQGELLCDPMPRFGELADGGITAAGAAAVVAYLRSIPAVSSPNIPSTGACPVPAPVDGGPEDAGHDAGDASAADAGDASVADAGDASVADAGDASVADSGDASVSDAGPDAAAGDAGPDAADGAAGDDAASDAGHDAGD
jgi:hypothetical protein